MNYYEKLLLENDMMAYADMISESVDYVETDEEAVTIESVIQMVTESDDKAAALKKELDDKMTELKMTKKPGKTLAKNILNMCIGGAAAGAGVGAAKAGVIVGGGAGAGMAVAGLGAIAGGVYKLFKTKKGMIEDVDDFQDMARYLKEKIKYVDDLIAKGEGDVAELKKIKAQMLEMKNYCYNHITARTISGSHS